jgi:hypothetical protein
MSDFITCDNNQLTKEQILAMLTTKDSDGNWALRVTFVDACSENAIDCSNNMLTIDQITKKVIGIDPVCGKPAIRLANTRAAEIQNLPEYANDAAAASASPSIPVGGLYYKTGVGIHTRMS